MLACPWTAHTRRLGAGIMGGRGPRDGNSPGHEWGRCSIHKCRVLLQSCRRWRQAGNPQPAGAAPPSASKSPLTICSCLFELR